MPILIAWKPVNNMQDDKFSERSKTVGKDIVKTNQNIVKQDTKTSWGLLFILSYY